MKFYKGKKPKTAWSLLKAVIEAIKTEPLRVDMGDWISTDVHDGYIDAQGVERDAPKCGTVGCIAGWCAVIAKPRSIYGRYEAETEETVTKLLGFEMESWKSAPELEPLFFVDNWPSDLQKRLNATKNGSAEYAAIVIERIERFMTEHEKHLKRTKLGAKKKRQ